MKAGTEFLRQLIIRLHQVYEPAGNFFIYTPVEQHLFGAAQGNLPVGMRGLYYYWRVGGGVVAPNALRYLEVL